MFPGFAFLFYEQIITIAKFEVFELQEPMADWFDLDPEEEPFNENFERLKYEA